MDIEPHLRIIQKNNYDLLGYSAFIFILQIFETFSPENLKHFKKEEILQQPNNYSLRSCDGKQHRTKIHYKKKFKR